MIDGRNAKSVPTQNENLGVELRANLYELHVGGCYTLPEKAEIFV